VSALLRQIEGNPDLWNQYTLRTDGYSPHTKIDDIWVRYNAWKHFDPKKPQNFSRQHDSTWYPAYEKLTAVRPLIFGAMSLIAAERLGGVLITRIPPGCRVEKHKDLGWHAGYYNRKFAIMLASNHRQAFCFDGESMLTDAGEVFEFDNSREHWVQNDSDTPRMTLIVCMRTTGR
jgi:aspartyl/asparaginyl beta-hydroxylase (cupin superfamily)